MEEKGIVLVVAVLLVDESVVLSVVDEGGISDDKGVTRMTERH